MPLPKDLWDKYYTVAPALWRRYAGKKEFGAWATLFTAPLQRISQRDNRHTVRGLDRPRASAFGNRFGCEQGFYFVKESYERGVRNTNKVYTPYTGRGNCMMLRQMGDSNSGSKRPAEPGIAA